MTKNPYAQQFFDAFPEAKGTYIKLYSNMKRDGTFRLKFYDVNVAFPPAEEIQSKFPMCGVKYIWGNCTNIESIALYFPEAGPVLPRVNAATKSSEQLKEEEYFRTLKKEARALAKHVKKVAKSSDHAAWLGRVIGELVANHAAKV